MDQILKKNPEHGESLALKGLIVSCLDQKDEAFDLVRKGLKYDLKSGVSWHIYGILHRTYHNYPEAIKSYSNALKYDKENVSILREQAVMFVQLRRFAEHTEMRAAILRLKPESRSNFTALAVAHHLQGHLKQAEAVLNAFESTQKDIPFQVSTYEASEALLYHNSIVAELEEYERALMHLEGIERQVLDKGRWLELRATYFLKLGRKNDALSAWKTLLQRNAECRSFFMGYGEAFDAYKDGQIIDVERARLMYDSLSQEFPRSTLAQTIPLDFLNGEDFRGVVEPYLKKSLQRGVPSLFSSVKGLYKNAAKQSTIGEIVMEFLQSNKATGDTSQAELPTFLLWADYFLAQHHTFLGNHDKALTYIDDAISHTPTLVELHLVKARIYKHKGDKQTAMQVMNIARELDLQDRYINCKASKYMLRNHANELAYETLGLFTRADTPGGPVVDLTDMQCMWFALEDGESFLEQNLLGLALKRFSAVFQFFDDWTEDQFDFHTYCYRKGTIEGYFKLLRWEKELRVHPYFVRAARGAVKAYIQLYEKRESVNRKPIKVYTEPVATNGTNNKDKEVDAAKPIDPDPQGFSFLEV